jgi:RNA polymerase sigma-70 factor (ECF subfamily)
MSDGQRRAATDADLVRALADGDDACLEELYSRYGGPCFALARRVLRDRAMAEEIVQEIFVRLWREPQRFDPGRGTMRAFLFAQVHGRSVDLLRSESARRQREQRDARSTAEAGYDLEHEVLDLAVADRVKGAMAELHENERRAIELAYLGGHTYREVAVLLGEPEGTVKSRIRSGLKKMRVTLVDAGVGGAR